MWLKRGNIYKVDGDHLWNKTHAQVPVVDVLNDRLRIYYASRNSKGQSNISFVEVSKKDPLKVLYIHDQVILELGAPGTFDDSGIMPTCIINVGELKYLYYIGWTTRNTVPFHNSVGLAISKDAGRSFEKLYHGPIITTNKKEPYFSGTAYVIKEANVFRMYYLSCIGWEHLSGKYEPLYHIKMAESVDGINWDQNNFVAIELEKEEGGIASASVIKNNDFYEMWYSVRAKEGYRFNKEKAYRIGYATSKDGLVWIRNDKEAGIATSENDWDSEMIGYPYVVDMGKELLMFYNGNGFGKTGFGYASKKK